MPDNQFDYVNRPKAALLAEVYKLILSWSDSVPSEQNETKVNEVSFSENEPAVEKIQTEETEQ